MVYIPDSVTISAGAMQKLSTEAIASGIIAHMSGDWGDVDAHDRRVNNAARRTGSGLMMSAFKDGDTPFWVMTNNGRTEVLLPEEY